MREEVSSLAHAKPAPKLPPARLARLPVTDITLSSPAILSARGAQSTIPRQYTCDGANHWPTLHWSALPADTAELALFVINVKPVDNKLFFDWAVAGLSPKLDGIQTGQLPAEAIQGRNGYGDTGYTICPEGPNAESYVFALYALPKSLNPHPGFNPTTLREQALETARHSGLLIGTYKRT